MDPLVIGTVAIAFLAAGFVKGVIGLGLPLTSVAIMTTILPIRDAIPLVVVPALVTNLVQSLEGGMIAAMLRRYWLLNAAVVMGTWLGTVLLFVLDVQIIQVLLGVVVLVYATINLSSFRFTISARWETPLSPAVGLVSGILSGTTGSVGMPVAIFLDALGLDKDRFVRAIALSFMISAAVLGIGLVSQGGFGWGLALLSLAALAPAFTGLYAGRYLRDRLSQDRFRLCVMLFLLLLGLNLLRKALM